MSKYTLNNAAIGKIEVNNYLVSPLRYPGGKASLTIYLENFIYAHSFQNCDFYEPYAGGAAVSLYLISKGLVNKAFLIEKDPLIFAFWHEVFKNHKELINRIIKLRVNLDTWYTLQGFRNINIEISEKNITDLAIAGLFFNRTNFSGILNAGPLGGYQQQSKYKIDCRFNKQRIIDQILDIKEFSHKFEIHHNDAVSFLKKQRQKILKTHHLLYIDPPYYIQGKNLYRYWYEDKDHLKLSKTLVNSKFNWLVSYDNHPFIQDIYLTSAFHPIYLDYSVKEKNKQENC